LHLQFANNNLASKGAGLRVRGRLRAVLQTANWQDVIRVTIAFLMAQEALRFFGAITVGGGGLAFPDAHQKGRLLDPS
jgi:hypothetical protein